MPGRQQRPHRNPKFMRKPRKKVDPVLKGRIARQRILRNFRGILNQHVHPTGYQYIAKHAKLFEFYFAIGHGVHEPKQPPFEIPDNVFVVFTNAPGYYGTMNDVVDQKFINLMTSVQKMRKLIQEKLEPNQVPLLMHQKNWNWKYHIYPPKSLCPHHELEFKEDGAGLQKNLGLQRLYQQYDNIAGMYHVPSTQRKFHGLIKNIKEIIHEAQSTSGGKPCMIFIAGCRGDPSIASQLNTFYQLHNVLLHPQKYARPTSNWIIQLELHEQRIRNSLTARRYNENAIKREIRQLPSGSKGIPAKAHINRLVSKYPNFFAGKNVNLYIKNVLKPGIRMFKELVSKRMEKKKQLEQKFKNISKSVLSKSRNENAKKLANRILSGQPANNTLPLNYISHLLKLYNENQNMSSKNKNVIRRTKLLLGAQR